MATGQTRFIGGIIPKKSAVPGKIPTGTTTGEIFSNLSDKKLWGFDGVNVFEYGSNSYFSLTGGTISGNTRVVGNFSADTLISGSTNLYSIFQPLGASGTQTAIQPGINTYTGGTDLLPSVNISALTINTLTTSGAAQINSTLTVTGNSNFQIVTATTISVYGVGSTSATTAMTITTSAGTNIMTVDNGGNINIGNYAAPAGQRLVTIGQNTAWVSIGSITSPTTSVGFYANQTTPSNSNYNFNINSSNSNINGATGVNLQIVASTRYAVTNTTHTWSNGQMSSSSANTFTFNAPNSTSTPLSTNVAKFLVNLNTTQWATGDLPTQDFALFAQPSALFVGASTATTISTFSIGGAPSASTNSLLKMSTAFLVKQGTVNGVGSVITSYGAYINAQSGATTNNGLGVNGDVVVTGNTLVSGTITAPTLYGSSALSGTLLIDSTSHATKGAVIFGTATASNIYNFNVGSSTSLITLRERVGATTQSAIYLGVASGSESNTNYLLSYDGTLRLNAQTTTTAINILAGNTGMLTITPASTVANSFYAFTPRARTSLTTASNIPVFDVLTSTQTWATGTVPSQYFNFFRSQTMGFAAGSTATFVASMAVAHTTVGTNATFGTGVGVYVSGGTYTSTSKAYGVLVDTVAGATTNYAIGAIGDVSVTGNTFVSGAVTASTISADTIVLSSRIIVASGTNASVGVVTLTGGTATVNNTLVTAGSIINLTPQTLGTITRPVGLGITGRTAGVSFTIVSQDATDTSTVGWMIIEPK